MLDTHLTGTSTPQRGSDAGISLIHLSAVKVERRAESPRPKWTQLRGLRDGAGCCHCLIGGGTILFHLLSPWWFTPIASNWKMMDDTVNITFVVTGIVFVRQLFMACAVFLYRHRQDDGRSTRPENKKLEWWLHHSDLGGRRCDVGTGFVCMGQVRHRTEDARWLRSWPAMDMELSFSRRDGVWAPRMPGFISPDNPFGIDPKDLKGADDILVVDSLSWHLPVNKPVKVLLRSKDVNHQWAVAQLPPSKDDMVPGMVTYFWSPHPDRTIRRALRAAMWIRLSHACRYRGDEGIGGCSWNI